MKAIYRQAWEDYLKLVDLVKGYKGSLDQLCKQLNGYNFDSVDERFDCNYGSITATVYTVGIEFFIYEHLDIWDDKATTLVKECIHYADVKDRAESED